MSSDTSNTGETQRTQPQENKRRRVLSIQSHVVSGYVGNKSAVFPLQLLGFDVDMINSVQFSNHTGYPNGFTGEVLNGTQLLSLFRGLVNNGLIGDGSSGMSHLVTGYIGSASFLTSVLEIISTLRRHDNHEKELCYVCDPVLGDEGKFYAPTELVKIYRDQIIPLSNVVTPNQFEVEQLTGVTVNNIEDAITACGVLHDLGPDLVVITSLTGIMEKMEERTITILASKRRHHPSSSTTINNNNNNNDNMMEDEIWRIDSPLIPGRYTGTGDLCAALLLAWTTIAPNDLRGCLEKVAGTMYSVIRRTADYAQQQLDHVDTCTASSSVKARELRLIQSKLDIEHPPILFKAKRIYNITN